MTANLDLKAKIEFLNKEIQTAIDHTKENRNGNKKKASIIKVLTIVLTGIATILLGLQIEISVEASLKQIAFVITGMVTLLNAFEPFFNFRALWIEHELALAKFYRIQREFDYYLTGKEESDLNLNYLDDLYNQYLEIWEELSTSWIEHRKRGK